MARKAPAERRSEFITEAQQLFYTKGYESTSVNDLINAVGVSKGAFYHHFESKQAVLEAVVDSLTAQTTDLMKPILEQDELNAIEKFKLIARTVNDWKTEQREQMLQLVTVLYSDDNLRLRHWLTAKTSRVIVSIWTQVFEQGAAEGVFDLGGVDKVYAAEFTLTLLRNAGETFVEHLLDPERSADAVALVVGKYVAVQTAVERILGAPSGSLLFIEPNDISAWFA